MSNFTLVKNNIIPSDLEMLMPSNGNIIKNIPSLVEQNLIKRIAKINNVNFKTGIRNPEIIMPSQYELLCQDIKNTTIQIIHNNLLFIILLLIIIIGLTYRYYCVKHMKHINKLKEEAYLEYLREQEEKNKIEVSIDNQQKQELNTIIDKFKFFDDSNIKQKINDTPKGLGPTKSNEPDNEIVGANLSSKFIFW